MEKKLKKNNSKGQLFRILNIYDRLNRGETVQKSELANEFNVSPKTIQRDIGVLKVHLADSSQQNKEIVYDNNNNYFKLEFKKEKVEREWITNKEVLVMAKILIESRSLNKEEMSVLINKLLLQATPNDRKHIKKLMGEELTAYVEPRHKKPLLDLIWELSNYISKNEIITYTYQRQDGTKGNTTVKPVTLMVSEYYFYLIAYKITDKDTDEIDEKREYPINYRVDRITNLSSTGEKFYIPYSDKFNDGEFRKRVQFMYSGELKKIKFEFSGPSLEAILDRIPTAKVIKEVNGVSTIRAECYGDGVEMWLRTQGDNVKFID